VEKNSTVVTARAPSFTAMWHAWLRNAHATVHPSPILCDTRSVQLVPQQTLGHVVAVMEGFSPDTADAIILMAVIRHRVLADHLPHAHARGVRQLVVLGAGLDTTAFGLPGWANQWRAFEVDHPATQEWKRQKIADAGWPIPPNLAFAPCDFEHQDMLSALAAAGFDPHLPAVVSLFGVILYLTSAATRATLAQLATLAPGSEVILTYCSPPAGEDPVVQEVFHKATPVVDATGESFVGYYREAELEAIVRAAGFRDAVHHPIGELNARYFAGRSDRLHLHSIERLLTAIC
jgi:methyltransferase (TIGR00027 family)